MSVARTCVGIFREVAHSPGRVEDDRAILETVAEALRARGFSVELVAPEAEFDTHFANIFAMCERSAVLDRLSAAERTNSVVVNSPEAIRNTYRHRMVKLFARCHVPSPASHIVASNAGVPRPPGAVWVKRYDFHATQSSDIMYAASEKGWKEALDRFAGRGIPFVVAQEHVPGDLVKFYGVRDAFAPAAAADSGWFEWFYHRDKGMLGYAFEASRLRRAALTAAAALGLEIFGGDAIIRASGEPVIVDINAWPSFALYRDRAAQLIAEHLSARFQRQPRLVAAE
jgi:glutathione synthase/RimK-type ligase-like ATP-grasp enzyme